MNLTPAELAQLETLDNGQLRSVASIKGFQATHPFTVGDPGHRERAGAVRAACLAILKARCLETARKAARRARKHPAGSYHRELYRQEARALHHLARA